MKKLIVIGLVLSLAVSLGACKATDVVGKFAVTSFEAVLNKIPDKVTSDEANYGWSLTSPTGERFIWGKDFSQEGKADVMLEFDAKPFLNAGLDVNKLPQDIYSYKSDTDLLVVHSELGNEKFTYNGEATPLDSFSKLVDTHRDNIGYHKALDHFGVALGNGNMFEWAKNMNTNDKDIVFVLNPEALTNAGVDPNKVEGWAFAKVEVMDEKGKTTEVDKFLKPSDLK